MSVRNYLQRFITPTTISTAPWVHAARAILEACSPVHPALQILPYHSALTLHHNTITPLRGPLARMASSLLALGSPAPPLLPTQQPGLWCMEIPIWGNPSLQLEKVCGTQVPPQLAKLPTIGALQALKTQLRQQQQQQQPLPSTTTSPRSAPPAQLPWGGQEQPRQFQQPPPPHLSTPTFR